jgi:hypothetical protein
MKLLALLFYSTTFLSACAFDIVEIKQTPTSLKSSEVLKPSLELEEEAKVSLGTGYSRTLKAKTRWAYVGSISYGDVFKTKDQILTVEASNIHEAYIVISSGNLVGFYLPVENSFSPLSNPIELKLREIEIQQ